MKQSYLEALDLLGAGTVHEIRQVDGSLMLHFASLGPLFDLNVAIAEDLTTPDSNIDVTAAAAQNLRNRASASKESTKSAIAEFLSPPSPPHEIWSADDAHSMVQSVRRATCSLEDAQRREGDAAEALTISTELLAAMFSFLQGVPCTTTAENAPAASGASDCAAALRQYVAACARRAATEGQLGSSNSSGSGSSTVHEILTLALSALQTHGRGQQAAEGQHSRGTKSAGAGEEARYSSTTAVSLCEGIVYQCFDYVHSFDAHSVHVNRAINSTAAAACEKNTDTDTEATDWALSTSTPDEVWRSTLALDSRVVYVNPAGQERVGTVVGVNSIRQEITIEYTSMHPSEGAAGAGGGQDQEYTADVAGSDEETDATLWQEVRFTLPRTSDEIRAIPNAAPGSHSAHSSSRQPHSPGQWPKHAGFDFYSGFQQYKSGSIGSFRSNMDLLNDSQDNEGMANEDGRGGEDDDNTDARSRSRSNSDLSTNSSVNAMSSSSSQNVDGRPASPGHAGQAPEKNLLRHFVNYACSCESLLASSPSRPGTVLALANLVEASMRLERCRCDCTHTTEQASRCLESFLSAARALIVLNNSSAESAENQDGGPPFSSEGTGHHSKQHFDTRKKHDRRSNGYGSIYASDGSSSAADSRNSDVLEEAVCLVCSSSSTSASFDAFATAAVSILMPHSADAAWSRASFAPQAPPSMGTPSARSGTGGRGGASSASPATAINANAFPTPHQIMLETLEAGIADENHARLNQQHLQRTQVNVTNNLFLLDIHTAAMESEVDLVELAEGVARVMHDIDHAVARAVSAGVAIDGVGIPVPGGVTLSPGRLAEVNDGSGAIIDINGGSHSVSSQQVIHAALRRRNESLAMHRLHAGLVAPGASDVTRNMRRHGAKGAAGGAPGDTDPAGKYVPLRSAAVVQDMNTTAISERKLKLTFAIKLIDCIKREVLLVLSALAEEVSQGSSAEFPIISDDPDTTRMHAENKAFDRTAERTNRDVVRAALGCLRALCGAGDDVLDGKSPGRFLFRHIVHLFISRYGLRCHMVATMGLQSNDIHDLLTNKCVPMLNIIARLQRVDHGYRHVLGEILAPSSALIKSGDTHSVPDSKRIILLSSMAMLDVFDKLAASGSESGFGYLCNRIIEHPLVYSNVISAGGAVSMSAKSSDVGLKAALKFHLLLPKSEHRYNKSSNMSSFYLRQLLGHLAKYANTNMLAALENIWREVIADEVIEVCNCADNSEYSSDAGYNSEDSIISEQGGLQSVMNGKVDTIIQFLQKCRDICRIDLAHKNMMCHMSADLGFMLAYKRLKKPIVLDRLRHAPKRTNY